jgi:hypothetical protein
MSCQQGVRGNDAGQAQQVLSTDGLAFHRQSAALVIIEARAFSQLFLEHTDFFLEIFNDDLLVPVHPSGTADQEEGQGIHDAIIPSADHGDQYFVAERPLRLVRQDPHSQSLNLVRVFRTVRGRSELVPCLSM